MFYIKVGKKFETDYFYKSFLNQINKYQKNHLDKKLVIDISECTWIDCGVVTNLLLIGYQLKNQVMFTPLIYANWDMKERVKKFLNEIYFVFLSEIHEIYEVHMIKTEHRGQSIIPPMCRAAGVPCNITRNQLNERLVQSYSKLYNDYFKGFSFSYNKKNGDIEKLNILEVFILQLCDNARKFAMTKEDYSFVAMQADNLHKNTKVSIADGGQGVVKTIKDKIDDGFELRLMSCESFLNLTRDEQVVVAIIEAFTYRYDEDIYGLFYVFKAIMEKEGEIYIHSDSAQIHFDKDCLKFVENAKSAEEFAYGLYAYIKVTGVNKIKTINYAGMHIEIIIPTKKDGE